MAGPPTIGPGARARDTNHGDAPGRCRDAETRLTGPRRPELRLRQGLVLLAGATVVALLVGSGPAGFYWTPLGIGLVYLAASLSGGRKGGYWAGAFVLCGWGAAVVYARQARPDLDLGGLYLAGAGLGAAAAVAARRLGIRSDPLGAAATVAASGTILAVSAHWSPLTEARTYALIVGAVGLVNVIWALVAQDEPGPTSAVASPTGESESTAPGRRDVTHG